MVYKTQRSKPSSTCFSMPIACEFSLHIYKPQEDIRVQIAMFCSSRLSFSFLKKRTKMENANRFNPWRRKHLNWKRQSDVHNKNFPITENQKGRNYIAKTHSDKPKHVQRLAGGRPKLSTEKRSEFFPSSSASNLQAEMIKVPGFFEVFRMGPSHIFYPSVSVKQTTRNTFSPCQYRVDSSPRTYRPQFRQTTKQQTFFMLLVYGLYNVGKCCPRQ